MNAASAIATGTIGTPAHSRSSVTASGNIQLIALSPVHEVRFQHPIVDRSAFGRAAHFVLASRRQTSGLRYDAAECLRSAKQEAVREREWRFKRDVAELIDAPIHEPGVRATSRRTGARHRSNELAGTGLAGNDPDLAARLASGTAIGGPRLRTLAVPGTRHAGDVARLRAVAAASGERHGEQSGTYPREQHVRDATPRIPRGSRWDRKGCDGIGTVTRGAE